MRSCERCLNHDRLRPVHEGILTEEAACLSWAESDRETRTRVLFAKVRIFNREQLIDTLDLAQEAKDTDLLLSLYDNHGTDCADLLIGDFAFAIWDANRRRVYAARDIMGCQPVYYSTNQHGFFIAERLEQLLDCGSVSKRDDEPFIAATLTRAFAHYERTFFAEIRKIPPGHYLDASPEGAAVTPYWRPEQVAPRRWTSHEDCLSEFRHLLREVVADRLPTHGRVGVHVSGGLDCSSIALLVAEMLAEQGRSPPLALTWYPRPHPGQSEAEKEEYERVEAVCARMDAEPIYTEPSVDTVLEVLDRDRRVRPICNASYNERCVLEQASASGVTTIFSGFGGDETASFDGRGYLEELALAGRWGKLARFAEAFGRGRLRFILGSVVNGLALRFASDEKLREFQDNRARPDFSRLRAYLRLLGLGGRSRLSESKSDTMDRQGYLHPDVMKRFGSLPPIGFVRTPDTRAARCNLLRWPGLITRVESMASDAAPFGVRHVYPFMDRRIVEFTLSLPSHAFRDEHWKRLFFRQAMDPVLPPEVCWRHVKDDPARVKPLLRRLKDAFAVIGRRYAAGRGVPARAQYVDMGRLIGDLEPNRLGARSRMGRLVDVVEFLGAARGDENPK